MMLTTLENYFQRNYVLGLLFSYCIHCEVNRIVTVTAPTHTRLASGIGHIKFRRIHVNVHSGYISYIELKILTSLLAWFSVH